MTELKDAGEESELLTEQLVGSMVHDELKTVGRSMIIDEGVRPDGRKTDEIRQLWTEVDIFPELMEVPCSNVVATRL